MNFSTSDIEDALTDGNKYSIGLLIGLTVGGVCAAAGVYAVTRFGIDLFQVMIGIFSVVLAGWVFVSIRNMSAAKRAKVLSALLNEPDIKLTFDRTKNCLIIERIGVSEFNGASIQTTLAREILTLDEAKRIGFIQRNTTPLLTNGSGNKSPRIDRDLSFVETEDPAREAVPVS